jgi:hypothetical protein
MCPQTGYQRQPTPRISTNRMDGIEYLRQDTPRRSNCISDCSGTRSLKLLMDTRQPADADNARETPKADE